MQTAVNKGSAPIRILMYHHIGPFPKPAPHQYSLYCHVDRFARQMALLARAQVGVISLDTALRVMQGQARLDKPAVVLSFDDGFQDFYDHAWPILKSHGFPAINYVISQRLGQDIDWDDFAALPGSERLMSAATLRTLATEGLEIGGHTATHPRLHQLSDEQRDREIGAAKQQLEDVLGREIRHFAYPFGDYDADVRNRVAEAGFISSVTTVRTRADKAPNVFEIPRIRIKYNNSMAEFVYKTRWLHGLFGPRLSARE